MTERLYRNLYEEVLHSKDMIFVTGPEALKMVNTELEACGYAPIPEYRDDVKDAAVYPFVACPINCYSGDYSCGDEECAKKLSTAGYATLSPHAVVARLRVDDRKPANGLLDGVDYWESAEGQERIYLSMLSFFGDDAFDDDDYDEDGDEMSDDMVPEFCKVSFKDDQEKRQCARHACCHGGEVDIADGKAFLSPRSNIKKITIEFE